MYDKFNILHEDNHILVVTKPFNMPSQADASKDPDLLNQLKDYLVQTYNKPGEAYLGLVHRLDRPTGGIMVFAKTSKAAARLSQQFKDGAITKRYLAVVVGCPAEESGILVHFLKKNPLTNVVNVVPSATTGAKRAELAYKVLQKSGRVSLMDISLMTGRSHQIRVQMNFIKCPVFGDVRYGGDIAKGYNLALFAYKLEIEHPITKQKMIFVAYPPETEEPWKRFDIERHLLIIK